MKINFVSNDFENYLLNKLNVSEITQKKLDEVNEISLNAIGNNGIKHDYDFRDFEKIKNLKHISLQNFIIRNYETNEINRCKNLECIQFSNCIFKSKCRLYGNIKKISFNNCKRFRFKYVSILRKLKIVNFSNMIFINLKRIDILKSLEKIYFENGRIFNLKKVAQLKNLAYIRIINCKWNKEQMKYINKNIEIEK